jgi:hypothetical protein
MEATMPEFADKFINNYLPAQGAPFFNDLKEMLYPGMNTPKLPRDKTPFDLAIHCPSVIFCIKDILEENGRNIINDIEQESDIHKKNSHEAKNVISNKRTNIFKCLGISDLYEPKGEKVYATLKIAALYHDIGKKIRFPNHPRLGANILKYSDKSARSYMIKQLTMGDKEDSKSNENRFSLVCSIVDHHDKFGVVSTGEGSLAIFSDILYYRNEKNGIDDIIKNITCVMLITLADIAAVCTAKDNEIKRKTQEIVYDILENPSSDHTDDYKKLNEIWQDKVKDKKIFMRLNSDKVKTILDDWEVLIDAVKKVEGHRIRLTEHLLQKEQDSDRTIKRIYRLIKESCCTTHSDFLLKRINEEYIESILNTIFGEYEFFDFCKKFACIVKIDYGLKFFKGIVCACVRDEISSKSDENDGWQELNPDEQRLLKGLSADRQQRITEKIITLFIRVISKIISRYDPILKMGVINAYRFGLQMRTLTDDKIVRDQIISYLCSTHDKNENVALTWISDEVIFWSMD